MDKPRLLQLTIHLVQLEVEDELSAGIDPPRDVVEEGDDAA